MLLPASTNPAAAISEGVVVAAGTAVAARAVAATLTPVLAVDSKWFRIPATLLAVSASYSLLLLLLLLLVLGLLCMRSHAAWHLKQLSNILLTLGAVRKRGTLPDS